MPTIESVGLGGTRCSPVPLPGAIGGCVYQEIGLLSLDVKEYEYLETG